ncbi:MAG: radical SAM/SPASM domain-containing protein [Bacteroidota bacterium]
MQRIVYRDTLNFLRKLSGRKIYNAALVVVSYYLSRWTRRPRQWGLPFTINFEPTTACNLRCPECPSGLRQFSRPTGNLKSDFFRANLDQLAEHLLYLIFYFQGEPYINPAFLDMVSHANDKGIYTITSTNGHFLNDANAKATIESGLDRLIISIDGTTQETYEQYRKEGKLEAVLQGVRNVVKWKRQLKAATPHIVLQFLVVRPNEHQIPEIQQMAKELGVDALSFKTAQVYDYEHGNPLIPEDERLSRYRQLPDGRYEPKANLHDHCWKLWHGAVITWDGLVVPCCFDKDATHQLGDLKQQSFQEVWSGAPYQAFRQQLFWGRDQIDICTNCTEGCKVWLSPE